MNPFSVISSTVSENSTVPEKGVNPNEWGPFSSLSQMEEQIPVSLGLLAAGETGDSTAVVHEILQAHLAIRVVTRQDLQQVKILNFKEKTKKYLKNNPFPQILSHSLIMSSLLLISKVTRYRII
jgi:hypothetical protein